MDIKGGKPVASRAKQRPLGVKTKTLYNGHVDSSFIKDAQTSANSTVSVLMTTQGVNAQAAERTAFPLPRYEAPEHPTRVVRKRIKRRTLILRVMAMCMVVFVTAWGLLLWNGYLKFHKVFHGRSIVAALSSKPAPQFNPLNGENGGRVNVLLMGTGGPGRSKPNVTDEITLLSIDTDNDTATTVSLPPDLWVQQPISYYGKEQKIDTVYQYGQEYYQNQEQELPNVDSSPADAEAAGIGNLDQVVEQVTGVSVDYNVLINFQGFQQAVDAVGGVTVNVPAELKDPTLAWYNHGNSVIARAGTQTMDGAQALLYARSHESTSNFSSLQRQLQLLVALKDKAMSAGVLDNPEEINSLTTTLDSNFYTDMTTKNAGRLYSILQKLGDNKVNSVNLMDSPQQIVETGSTNGETVVLPSAGYNSYAAIQEFVRGQLPMNDIVGEDAPITVMSRTEAGAQLTGNFLKSYGFDVTATEPTPQPVSKFTLVDLSNGQDPNTLKLLENHYGVKATDELPAGISIPQGSAKFVIIEP
jgi:LCP family protein required for cell wall assembly